MAGQCACHTRRSVLLRGEVHALSKWAGGKSWRHVTCRICLCAAFVLLICLLCARALKMHLSWALLRMDQQQIVVWNGEWQD